jgi:ABC-2 type transport system ATP-binding protein
MKQVTKKFKHQLVLDHLDLTIAAGEIVGLIGPNAAGKSTTLHVMSGLIQPDSGQILIEEKPAATQKHLIGFVPQEIALYQDLSVRDNLIFFSGLYGLSAKTSALKINEILSHLDMDALKKKKVKHLSGGMKRRLNIGVELLKDPTIMMLDEATVGIDSQTRTSFFSLIQKMNQNGITVILTSHHLPELEQLCSYFYFLKEGRIVLSGSKSDLLTQDNQTINLSSLYQELYLDS